MLKKVLAQHYTSKNIVGQSGLSVQLCVLNTYEQLGNDVLNLDLYNKLHRQGMKKVCEYWSRWKKYVTKEELKFQSERAFTTEYEEAEEAATAILALTAVAVNTSASDSAQNVITSPLQVQVVQSLAEPTVIVSTELQAGSSGASDSNANNLNQDENLQLLMAMLGTKYYYMYIVDNVFDVIVKLGVMSFEISLNIITVLNGSNSTQIASKLKEMAYKNTVRRYLTYYSASVDPVIFPLKTIGTDKEKWIQEMVCNLKL
jgi:hypothetical protein